MSCRAGVMSAQFGLFWQPPKAVPPQAARSGSRRKRAAVDVESRSLKLDASEQAPFPPVATFIV